MYHVVEGNAHKPPTVVLLHNCWFEGERLWALGLLGKPLRKATLKKPAVKHKVLCQFNQTCPEDATDGLPPSNVEKVVHWSQRKATSSSDKSTLFRFFLKKCYKGTKFIWQIEKEAFQGACASTLSVWDSL